MVVRMAHRRSWNRQGQLLWILQRAFLRYLPMPLPAVTDVEAWKKQAMEMVNRGAWPRSWHLRCLDAMSYNLANLKELIHLRGQQGLELSFLEDGQTLMAVQTLKKKPKKVVEHALLQERRRLEELSGTQRKKRIEELIGPRGGLPRLKGELQELCVLCNVDINEDMTVAKLTELLKPMIAAFKGTGELPPTRVEVAQAKAVAARKSAAKPKPAPKALAVPVLQGTPVNVEPLPPDHQMDPRVARQIMAMRTLMAQHAEPGAELDPWGNPILQVESAQDMMSMLSEAAETVDSMNWEPDYAARAEFYQLDTDL